MTSKIIVLVGIIAIWMISCSVVDSLVPTAVVEVTNPETGRVWMDRNLGARRPARSLTDSRSFGDLYQWGRGKDGHEDRNSSTNGAISDTDQPGHNRFIRNTRAPGDWRIPQNDNLWQGVRGTNNPCPRNFRIPTAEEWEEEIKTWSSQDAEGALASTLRLPFAGFRSNSHVSLVPPATVVGLYWSSTVTETEVHITFVNESNAGVGSSRRAFANSVRCIRD